MSRDGEPWLAHGDEALLPASAMQLAGLHNAANALAAMALVDSVGVPRAASLAALRAFAGLPHRVQFAGEIGGVRMINALQFTDFLYRPRRPEELMTEQGGGVIFNQAPHQVDNVRMIGGGRVKSVRAATGAWDA